MIEYSFGKNVLGVRMPFRCIAGRCDSVEADFACSHGGRTGRQFTAAATTARGDDIDVTAADLKAAVAAVLGHAPAAPMNCYTPDGRRAWAGACGCALLQAEQRWRRQDAIAQAQREAEAHRILSAGGVR